jgi:hypothetical protein
MRQIENYYLETVGAPTPGQRTVYGDASQT